MDTLSTKVAQKSYYIARRDEQFFAFNSEFVSESIRIDKYTKIPGTRSEFVGAINLRNSILPILLPDQWLLTPKRSFSQKLPLVIINFESTQLALQFDEIIGVLSAESDRHLSHPYRHEVPYFDKLVTLKDGRILTTINVSSLLEEVNTLSI